MKLLDIVKELLQEKKQKFDYGCAMLYFDFPEMKSIHSPRYTKKT